MGSGVSGILEKLGLGDLGNLLSMVQELSQMWAVGLVYGGSCAGPFNSSVVDEEYLLSNAAHRAHVVAVDDGGDAILVRDVADESVYDARRYGVESRVGFIAEEIAWLKGYGARYGYAFLHAAAQFGRHFILTSYESHAVEAEAGTLQLLAVGLG